MYKRILAAIDGSDHSRLVIPTAIEVGRKFQSEVFVLHISEHDRGRAAVFNTESPADATRMVGDAVKAVREAGVEATGDVQDVAAGRVAHSIVSTAAALECDLIVMGTRGLSDVQGVFLGSVTHQVLHMASIAVLVAKGPIPVHAKQPKAAFAVPSLALA